MTFLAKNFKPSPTLSSNMSKDEQNALRTLQSRRDIVIKPADKGGAIVLWNKELYLQECYRQLNNTNFYRKLNKDNTLTHNNKVKKIVNELIEQQSLPPEAKVLAIPPSELGAPTFYLLPKIHKMKTPSDTPPGRPIVSACSCPTERISAFLDTLFQPYVKNLNTYVKDTNHALNLFNSYTFSDLQPRLLFTMDVTSLYTSIPHQDGLKAIQFFLTENPPSGISTDTVLRLVSLVLNMNSFEFDGGFYQQVSGVAMGTKMGPSYACLFMGYLERQIWDSYPGPLPNFFRRYIDDIVGITTMEISALHNFFEFVNKFHPSIHFTTTTSSSAITFLDIRLFLTPFCLSTSVHYKETDSHCYLRYSSSHPKTCRDSIPFSQLMRLRRLCSEETLFRQEAHKMIDFFKIRGYPNRILKKAYKKALDTSRNTSLKPKTRTQDDENCKRPKLVVTYHPHIKPLVDEVKSHFQILLQDPDTKEAFPQPPLIVYRRARNIRDYLVRSRMPRALPSNSIGTFPCHRDCITCKYVTRNSTWNFPKGKWVVRSSYTCESRNLIYGIECGICHLYYIGQTGRRLSDRFTEHLSDIKNLKDCPVARHFNAHPFRPSDISVFVLRRCASTYLRVITERQMIVRYGTLRPHGINVSLFQ